MNVDPFQTGIYFRINKKLDVKEDTTTKGHTINVDSSPNRGPKPRYPIIRLFCQFVTTEGTKLPITQNLKKMHFPTMVFGLKHFVAFPHEWFLWH